MYVINDFQLIETASSLFINNHGKGAKLSHKTLYDILNALRMQEKLEISEEDLLAIANQHQVHIEELKKILITQLNVLKPMQANKFPLIYIDADDPIVVDLLQETLSKQYHVVIAKDDVIYASHALIIFYRQNYSSTDFEALYQKLPEEVYLVTAGVLHKLLLIDNLYFKGSGLPTHFSHLHQLTTYLKSDITASKNNWLLFYRELYKNQMAGFPDPQLNACQRGYIAYALFQFASQFTHFWKLPTPLDQMNWFWHVDLSSFQIHTEVAIHSPFSEYDMKINLIPPLHQESA